MTTRPPLLLIGTLSLVAALPACGHRGDPRPPLRRTPPAPTEFHLAQRGSALELSATAPATSVDGVALPAVALEFLHGSGKADLEKTGSRTLVKAVPGAPAVATLPLPVPGTLVRVTARVVAGGQRGARTLTLALVAQAPLEAPHQLEAKPAADGIHLSWEGEAPKEVPPLGPSTPGLPGAVPPSGGPLAPGAKPGGATGPAASKPTSAPPPTAPPTPEKTTPSPVAGGEAPKQQAPPPPPPPKRRSGFRVYRRGADAAYGSPLTEEPLEGRTAIDAQAPLGVRLCYVVRAVGSTEPLIESAPSNETCLERRDVTPPAPPAGLAVLPRGGGLELLWSPSTEEDLAGYRVYRSTGGEAPERLAELTVGEASYLDQTAKKGIAYRYALTAFDRTGNESTPSEPVEAVLP